MALDALEIVLKNIPERHRSDLVAFLRNEQTCQLTLAAQWVAVIGQLQCIGQFDLAIESVQQLLQQDPQSKFLSMALADMLRKVGRLPEAQAIWRAQAHSDAIGRECGFQLLVNGGGAAETTAFEDILLADGQWRATYHLEFVRYLIRQGAAGRAHTFLGAWAARHQVDDEAIEPLGEAALLLGEYAAAKAIFSQRHWLMNSHADALVGKFDMPIPDYSTAIEQALLDKIEAARAGGPRTPGFANLGNWPKPDPGISVLFLSFENVPFANDLAMNFGGSARSAGVKFEYYLDSVLIDPQPSLCSEDEIARLVSRFEEKIASLRPSIVMIDCFADMSYGLTVDRVIDLRAQFGFRLVCIFRDSSPHMSGLLNVWLPACDSLVVFDAGSSAFDTPDETLRAKVIAMQVPTFHSEYLDRPPKEFVLTFVGAVNFKPRLYMLAELLNLPIPFHAVFGLHRSKQVPDMAAYAHLLARSHAVLNVARHGVDFFLMTGRVWETVAAGSLLVEQENPITQQCFTPYLHYLPWTNVADIAHIAQFIAKHPDIAAEIAQRAHVWAKQHFGTDIFWRKLLAHVLRPLETGHEEARERIKHNWAIAGTGSIMSRLKFIFDISDRR